MSSADAATPSGPSLPDVLAKMAGRRLEVLVAYGVLLALVVVYATVSPGVLTLDELNIQATTAFALILVATGQTIVLLTGGIDLSVGGVVSLATCIAATTFEGPGSQVMWFAIIVLVGVVIGLVNGVLVTYLGLEPFIVTFATWSLLSGVALLVLSQAGGTVPQSYIDAFTSEYLGVGAPVLMLGALIAVWLWFRSTRLGTSMKAVGSSAHAAHLAGVALGRVKLIAYAASGGFAALGGLFLITQIGAGDPLVGNEYVLSSIAAAVIGGASLVGGRADVLGTIAGALIYSLLGSVVFVLELPALWQPVAAGVLLLVAALGGSLVELHRARVQR